jgi:hypothetical protein
VLWFGFCPRMKKQFDLLWNDHPGVSESTILPVFYLYLARRLSKFHGQAVFSANVFCSISK